MNPVTLINHLVTEVQKIVKAAVVALKSNTYSVNVRNYPKTQEVKGTVVVGNLNRIEAAIKGIKTGMPSKADVIRIEKVGSFETAFPAEITVKNLKDIQIPKPLSEVRVSNPQKEVSVTRFDNLLEAVKRVETGLKALKLNTVVNPTPVTVEAPIVQVPPMPAFPQFPEIESQISDDPERYVPVRLTDGKKFYEAITNVLGGLNKQRKSQLVNGAGTELGTESNPLFVSTETVEGGATADNQDEQTALLTTIDQSADATETATESIDTKTPTVGQKTMANSRPVVIASDQSVVPVAGTVASAAADSGNPVKIGGVYNSTKPSFTTGQRGDLQLGTRGSLAISLFSPDSTLGANVNNSNTDGQAFSNGLSVYSQGANFNGTNWDRLRNNVSAVALAAGQTTTQSATITTYNASKLIVVLRVSAYTSGSVTISIDGNSSSSYVFNLLTGTAVGAVGTTAYRVGPGLTAAANSIANDIVPRSVTITATVSGTLTYGVDYLLGV